MRMRFVRHRSPLRRGALLAIVLTAVWCIDVAAQEAGSFWNGEATGLQTERMAFSVVISMEAWTAFAATADSLPDGMPFGKRLFWGERGLVRLAGLSPASRADELELRRRMLQWHQRAGFATWAALSVQMVAGELIHRNPADHYQKWQPVHRTLGYTTFGLYSTTAGLQLLAPPAFRYGGGVTNITFHRGLAYVHFAGMMAQPFLGVATARASKLDERNRALNRHRVVGWITYAAYTGAIVAIFIPL
jgi:hypothetical protein